MFRHWKVKKAGKMISWNPIKQTQIAFRNGNFAKLDSDN